MYWHPSRNLWKTRFATCLVVHVPGGCIAEIVESGMSEISQRILPSHARQGKGSELEPLGLLDAGEK